MHAANSVLYAANATCIRYARACACILYGIAALANIYNTYAHKHKHTRTIAYVWVDLCVRAHGQQACGCSNTLTYSHIYSPHVLRTAATTKAVRDLVVAFQSKIESEASLTCLYFVPVKTKIVFFHTFSSSVPNKPR